MVLSRISLVFKRVWHYFKLYCPLYFFLFIAIDYFITDYISFVKYRIGPLSISYF